MQHDRIRPSLALAAALLATPLLVGQTVVNVPCTKDNTLYQSATGALSSGSGPSLFVGVTGQPGLRRALLQFDVAAVVPAGAHIVSAELSINVTFTTFGGSLDVFGHRVLASWGEGASIAPGGGGGGAPAATGDATWLHTSFPTTMWTNAGGDFAAAPSLTVTTTPLGIATSAPSSAIVNDVQSWLDNPATNHGWLLKTSEALPFVTRKLDSRETTVGVAPSLSISFVMPGQTGSFGTGCPVGTQTFTHALTGPFVGGTTVSLVQSNGPAGQLAANLISLELNHAGFPLLPGCQLLLPLGSAMLSHSIVTLDANGGKVTPFSLPSGFPGIAIFSQSAALSPTSAAGFVLSNAAVGLLQ